VVQNAVCSGELFPGEASSLQPSAFSLPSVSPNPFNPTTAISYQLAAFSHVSLKVYDVCGNVIMTLVDCYQEGGSHSAIFDGSNLASGLYIYTLKVGPIVASGKMMLIR
jgi:hypothetical protein